ncbi:MAG: hypothetical protein V3T00_09130 [bacterium]
MKPAPGPSSSTPFVRFGRVYAVPSLHARWSFAALVRAAFHSVRPQAIAVELPGTLEISVRKGVERLPYLSVVSYKDFDEDLDEVNRIVPITPEDSLVEAVRLGMEHGTPLHFVDRDILNYQPEPVRAPDDYIIHRIGLERYWREVAGRLQRPEPGSPDDDREIAMAAALRQLTARHERVLFVCGLAHLDGVAHHLEAGTPEPPGAVSQREQTLYNLGEESIAQALQGIPNMVYAYELARRGMRPADFPQLRPLPLTRGGEYQAARDARAETTRQVLDALRQRPSGEESIETYDALSELVQTAVSLYEREWKQKPSPSRLATLLRFARNMALVGRRLTPTKYMLALAAKNTVNDDFAFQALRVADDYPFYDGESGLPELKMEEGRGESEGEFLVLRLRLPPSIRDNMDEGDLDLEAPPEEGEEGSWEERWDVGERRVSHLPQDDKLEEFFEYLRRKCRALLSDQRVRTHEFQASMMDGLDIRETLRNLPLGKVYVKEQLPGMGDVGPLVVIFHKADEENRYPHEQMWFAEHDGESDLALYSTEPGVQFDGPGISRCQYGGVLSLYPPTGRAQVWGNPRYRGARTRAELLLRAAIDLSRKPIVGYIARSGPSPQTLAMAASRGIHVMYIPLDSLSADSIKRVQTFHILADREIRPLAPLYVN